MIFGLTTIAQAFQVLGFGNTVNAEHLYHPEIFITENNDYDELHWQYSNQ